MSETHTAPVNLKNIKKIFFIVLLAIIADQTVDSVILEIIAPIKFSFGNITHAYLLTSMPFALILATWSDFHCRRKTMIFALACLSISAIVISCYHSFSSNWVIYTALAFKGIGGNVTPVALASLATIVPSRKFTLYLAIAICAYSLGILVSIYLHSFEQLPQTATLLAILCTVIVIRSFREKEFDNFKFQNNTASFGKFFSFLRKDLIAIGLFSIGVSAMLALFGYLTSEISFYQILLRGEVLGVNSFYSNLALKIGLSYYFGTFILYLLKRKNVSDARCLNAGITIALISILLTAILYSSGINNTYVLDGTFAFFSIGFALLTPSLFSILSQIRRKDEQGKIYGFLDTYDTLAAFVSVKYIGMTTSVSFTYALWLSFIILLVSALFILAFIRDIKERKINMS
ncbi:MAG: MFS transporter [Chlamydiales bacterium]|nr:MFS transporter [Chlamydiales bacterium]